jgi:MOSC domain-containing protein YiiM
VAHLVSVNVGLPRAASWTTIGRTSIDKTAVSGPVLVQRLGLVGDQVSNRRHHGGLGKAVYAFAEEDLAHWAAELGTEVAPGQFGENLTTRGIDVNEAEVGSRWEVGDAVLEICSVRTPCQTFRGWQAHCGHDARGWLRRFTLAARPGPYLRVVAEGELSAGDEIRVVHEPGHGVSVSMMFRAITTEPDLLPRVEDALASCGLAK